MANFAYKALDARGGEAVGQIEGESKAAVAAALRSRGLTVLDLNEVKQGWGQIEIGGNIKAKDLTVFSRQFATMVNSGLSMLRCLYVLEEQTPNKKLAKVVGEVRGDVEAGISLSDALEKHPKVFSRLYVSMVRAGELGGILDEVLNRLATQLEKEDSIRRAVKSAMVYPMLIGSFAIIVLIGMMLFLIPIFANMYKDLSTEGGGKEVKLPMLTRIMMAISHAMLNFPWNIAILAGIVAVIYAFLRFKRTDRGTHIWDRFKLHIPMGIGEIIRKLAVARFSRTLGTLITSGVPILEALSVTARTSGNSVLEEALMKVRKAIEEGRTIVDPLRECGVFPNMVTQMIGVGEATGAMDSMLQKIADFYEDEVDSATKDMLAMLEPIIIGLLGVMIGGIVISLYMPLFAMIAKLAG